MHTPACHGVVWDPALTRCYYKTSAISTVDVKPSTVSLTSALVFKSQMEQDATEFVCPYPNLSIHKTDIGREYKILCGAVYAHVGDMDLARLHKNTMDECLDECSTQHPLCSRVNFNSDLIGVGWLNCWLKTKSTAKPSRYTRTMAHAAEAIMDDKPPDADCKTGSIRTTSDGRRFKMSCSDLRDWNDTAALPQRSSHEMSIEACTQQCISANFTCSAMLFDRSFQSGYQNCFLFQDIPQPDQANPDTTFMYLESLSPKFQPPPPPPPAAKKLWIIGAVLGPVTFLTVVVFLIDRCKVKRKKKTY